MKMPGLSRALDFPASVSKGNLKVELQRDHDRPEITKLFGDQIKGKALDVLARPLRPFATGRC